MPKLLVLNHHGASVPALIERIREAGANFEVIEPENVKRSSAHGFDGLIASGGYLRAETYRKELEAYSLLLEELDRPFLGVCLGLKILGYCYGARMRKIPPVVGTRLIRFQREYPLAPRVRECTVYQSHRYELLLPLPDTLENFATDSGSAQAVKTRGMERYGIQFHPELSESPARSMIRNFISLC